MTHTAYYVVDGDSDDDGDDRPGFITYDAERAERYSRSGYRVTAVTGTEPRTADIYV